MNTEQIDKLKARANTLLDLFISLRERYTMLEPMAFDEELIKRWAKGPPARGFLILRNTLLTSCVSEVSKIALDADARAPSIRNIMSTLEDERVREVLKGDFSASPHPPGPDMDDPDIKALIKQMEKTEEEERRKQFIEIWESLRHDWADLVEGDELAAFKVWRDKLIAHSDLHHSDGEYHLLDLSDLGVQWRNLREVISALQGIVDSINLLVRGASFAFDMLDEQLAAASNGFWWEDGWRLDESEQPNKR